MLRTHQGFGRLACCFENQPYIVPIHFCVDGEFVYSFSMPGQKLQWMRQNELVCLEIDDVRSWNDWTSIVALACFEELPIPRNSRQPGCARSTVEGKAMWWQPGGIPLENNVVDHQPSPSSIVLRSSG